MIREAASEAVTTLAKQVRRGRAEKQETPRTTVAIDQASKYGKKIRQMLDFIEDNEAPSETFQIDVGIFQSAAIGRAFEVEINTVRPRCA